MRPFWGRASLAAPVCVARLVVAGLVVAGLAVAGCGSSGTAATPRPDAVHLSASGLAFQQPRMEVPASEAFQLYFENLEAAPHNVNIVDGFGASVARGEVFMGPSGRTLQVAALGAGTRLLCDVHPEMAAQLIAS